MRVNRCHQLKLLAPIGRQTVLGQGFETARGYSHAHPLTCSFIEEAFGTQIRVLPLARLVVGVADGIRFVATAACDGTNSGHDLFSFSWKRGGKGLHHFGFLHERQQGQVTGALDGERHEALLLAIQSGQTARQDPAIGGDEALQELDVFVVNELNPMLFEIGRLSHHSGANTGRTITAAGT